MPVQRRDPVRWLPGPLLGDARRALDQHEAVIGDVQDGQVGDDAVDDEYHGERQGTLQHDLEVSVLGDVLHPEITFPSLPAPRQSVDIAVAAAGTRAVPAAHGLATVTTTRPLIWPPRICSLSLGRSSSVASTATCLRSGNE